MSTTMTNNTSSNQQQQQQSIHQYLTLLTQQTKPNISFIHSIILKAISDPSVNVGYAEISALPLIQQTLQESTAGKSLLNTLDLFSYGSYLDYEEEGLLNKYIKLTDVQLMKLKLLTVVTIVQQTLDSMKGGEKGGEKGKETNIVQSSRMRRSRRHQVGATVTTTKETTNSKNCGVVQYSELHKALGTEDDIRKLEDILIKCIYSNLLPSGTKLDQKNMCLVVKHSLHTSSSSSAAESQNVLCRDVNLTHDVPDMISKLEMMYSRGENVKNHLKKSLNGLNQGIVDDVEQWKKIEETIRLTKEKVKEKNSTGAAAGILGDMDLDMDMDIEGDGGHGFGGRFSSGFRSMTSSAKRQLKRSRGGRRG